MNGLTCAEASDRLPDWVAGRLVPEDAGAVAGHVASCADCAADAALMRALRAGAPAPPAGLGARIGAAVRAAEPVPARTGRPSWRAWAGSAAAVLVLAIGALLTRDAGPGEDGGLGRLTAEQSVWIADDGIVAGAPVLDELPEEQLAALLEEMGG